MALPRPYWKGYLKLSLVSCPVALYSAASSGERVAFKQINKTTGNRIRQQLIDDETRELVQPHEKGRGYEVDKDRYIMVEDDEIADIAIESSHTIDIDRFVPRAQIDERYLDAPYYIAPNDKVGQDAFGVIREAMRGKDMAALGRIVMSKRERVIMLQPWDKGLLGMTLRYPYEVRDPAQYFSEIEDGTISTEMRTLAEHILESKAGDFDPTLFKDRFEDALVAMLKTKEAGLPAQKYDANRPVRGGIVDLMTALKKSLEASKPAAKLAKAKAKKPVVGQREMLLPIDGKKPAAKETAARRSTPRRKTA